MRVRIFSVVSCYKSQGTFVPFAFKYDLMALLL